MSASCARTVKLPLSALDLDHFEPRRAQRHPGHHEDQRRRHVPAVHKARHHRVGKHQEGEGERGLGVHQRRLAHLLRLIGRCRHLKSGCGYDGEFQAASPSGEALPHHRRGRCGIRLVIAQRQMAQRKSAMLRIRDHRVDDYTLLRNIGTTDVGVLGDDDRACLDEIGQFLVLHDAWHRFAIWLLHKYFDPAPGEVFVERVITSGREMETTPLARSVIQAGGLMMTGMRFDDSAGPGVSVIGMEFADSSQCGPARPVIDDDEVVLSGIAERLRARRKDRPVRGAADPRPAPGHGSRTACRIRRHRAPDRALQGGRTHRYPAGRHRHRNDMAMETGWQDPTLATRRAYPRTRRAVVRCRHERPGTGRAVALRRTHDRHRRGQPQLSKTARGGMLAPWAWYSG